MGQKRRNVFFQTVPLKNDVPDRIVLTSHFINEYLLKTQGQSLLKQRLVYGEAVHHVLRCAPDNIGNH